MIRTCITLSALAVLCFHASAAEPVAPKPAAEAPAVAPVAAEPTVKEQMEQLRALQEKIQTRLLAVPDEDKQRFADFLKQPDTGLIKLLPRETYDRVLRIRGGGAYYSFALRTHEYGHGSDISLEQRRLTSGFAGGAYGYFLELGDAPIEKAAEVTDKAAPDWAPAEAVKRWDEFWRDAPVDQREHWLQRQRQGGLPMIDWGVTDVPGKTYLLRAVDQGRSDTLIAFRVEHRFAEDGSILLSWKILKKFAVVDRMKAARERMQQMQLEAQKRMREQQGVPNPENERPF